MNKIIILFLVFLFQTVSMVKAELPYNFSDISYVPIKLSIVKDISTKDEIYEGQEIEFKVRKNVYCHDCLIIKKGTIVKGRIETIITKGMNGFPAELILDNFQIAGINKTQLIGEYIKVGRNYAPLVYPIKWALTPIPFVGSLTNLITGGEANLKTEDIITIKYYPHWK